MAEEPQVLIEELVRRVRRLESEVEQLRAAAGPPPAAGQSSWTPPTAAPARWPAPQVAAPVPPRQRQLALESETVLKWGGVGLVVLAVGFAVSTAISRGWIGPELQLVGAGLVSFGLIGAGLHLRPTRPAWTHALSSGGIAAMFTTVASNLFLDQASDRVAFVATATIGLGGAVLARSIRSEWVGGVVVLGGLIGWFVIGDGEPSLGVSAGWVALLAGVVVVLALEQEWFALRFLGHASAMVALLALTEGADDARPIERALLLVAACLVASSLVRVPSIGDLASVWQQLEVQLVIAMSPWAFGMLVLTFDLDSDTDVGSVAIAVAVGSLLVSVAVRATIRPAHLVSLLVGASVTLSIGLAVLLSTSAALVAVAVQGAGLVVLARVLGGSVRVLVNAAVVLLVVVVGTIDRMFDAWTDDVSVGDDAAHLAVIAAIAVAGWQSRQREIQRIGAIGVLALLLVWLGSVLVHLPQGQAAVSVAWAIVGTAVLVAGAVRRAPDVGAVGLVVLGVTVGKLLTVDLQEVDTLWRAGLFLVVGLGFLRLGFLLPRLSGSDAGGPSGADSDGATSA